MVNHQFIRARRLYLGLTQGECARTGGLSSGNYWSDLERGKRPSPNSTTLGKVSAVLGCSIDDILSDRDHDDDGGGNDGGGGGGDTEAVSHRFRWP